MLGEVLLVHGITKPSSEQTEAGASERSASARASARCAGRTGLCSGCGVRGVDPLLKASYEVCEKKEGLEMWVDTFLNMFEVGENKESLETFEVCRSIS